jgi:hypothetical protein
VNAHPTPRPGKPVPAEALGVPEDAAGNGKGRAVPGGKPKRQRGKEGAKKGKGT